MRIDHHAYQRGTQVAAFGFFLQFAIGLTLLIFGWVGDDTTLRFASAYVLLGSLVWLSLVVIFHQHKLERLEALEEDEMAAARGGTSSMFDAGAEEHRVAARRLALMYKWLMPTVSLVLAGLLVLLAYLMLVPGLGLNTEGPRREIDFAMTPYVGWTVALCLSIALLSFIFSRFVAGMAKLPAWQNLRGGAGYMVGNALVMIAVAAGTVFRVFDNTDVIFAIAHAIPIFMAFVALEIILNFVLNMYRPRIPGETPRAAFDSRILSLLAAPDSLVRSLNEAVNYQFGFDITSSWGYQLLIRSFAWLVALGVGVLILLNTMVVVEPHQQAVKMTSGRLVGGVHGPGVMWKWPWPIQTAEIYSVSELRTLNLTPRQTEVPPVSLWTTGLRWAGVHADEVDPFIVGASTLLLDHERYQDVIEDMDADEIVEGIVIDDAPLPAPDDPEGEVELFVPEQVEPTPEDRAAAVVSRVYALLDAEITLEYRIRDGSEGGGGLLDFLTFVPDTPSRRRDLDMREHALKSLALREVTQHLSSMTLDEVLAVRRDRLASDLRERVQRAFDERSTGVEVVAVNLPMIRPARESARRFEELAVSNQARQQMIALARRNVTTQLAHLTADVQSALDLLDEIEKWNALRDQLGGQAPEVAEMAAEIERRIVRSGGMAAQIITEAERDRWVQLMDARAQANRTRGQQWAYNAAPELYRQREIMNVVMNTIAPVRKYVIGIDPRRVNVDVELKELSPLLDFASQAFGEGE